MTQFSLFGAEVAEPTLEDLGGVLLAGGHWVRSHAGTPSSRTRDAPACGGVAAGASTARLSVVVADRWRADALAEEFALRGVGAPDDDAIVPAEGGWGVRTAFAAELGPHAVAWTRGANEGPPPGFELTAAGLRLWTIAMGRDDEAGYLLATAEPDDPVHRAGGAQLARLGVAAASIVQRGGPGWRVTSLKRIRRLAELVGAAPHGAGHNWPQAR